MFAKRVDKLKNDTKIVAERRRMKIINRDTDCALRILLALAGRAEYVSAKDLAKTVKQPYAFTRKILYRLVDANLVETISGRKGGFRLKKAVDSISLYDVLVVFQGPIHINDCLVKGLPCANRKTCPLRKRLLPIDKKLENEFKKVTIKDLLYAQKRR